MGGTFYQNLIVIIYRAYIDKKSEKKKEKIRFDEMKKRPIVNEYKLSMIDKCQCSSTCQNYMKVIRKEKEKK